MGTILKNGINYSGTGSGGGVSSYNELTNKPSINNVTLTGNKTTADLGITSATKTSDLTNDSGFYSSNDTAETTLADGDSFPFYDVSASGNKKTLWSNIKSALSSVFQSKLTAGTNISFSGTNNTTINASMPVMGTFSKGDLYDTSEKIIGKWTDGRPLYQRTYSGTIPSSDGTQALFSLPSSYCRVMYAEGCAFWDGTNYISIPFSTESSSKADHAGLYTYNNTMYIDMTDTNSYFRGKSYYVTIRYIKTSDSTNSYNYASENDYSTSEKIIGTWVNGKTLYQRTFSGVFPSTTSGTYADNAIATITNVSAVVSVQGYYQVGNTFVPVPWISNGGYISKAKVDISGTTGTLSLTTNNSGMNSVTAYITLKYTKAS